MAYMRILRVAQKLYPEVPGGGIYHVHAMRRDQAAMGHVSLAMSQYYARGMNSASSKYCFTYGCNSGPTVSTNR